MPEIATLLVIDDEPAFRCQLQLVLQKSGYRVLAAGDVEQGTALLGAADPPVDVVLTDLIMPGTDGLAILRHIQERKLDISVIVMTAFGSMNAVMEALRLGAYDFLTKPFSLTAMLVAVSRACERQHLRAEAAKQEGLIATLELAGAVAHELNQPLLIIMGVADLLLHGRGRDDPLAQDLEAICQAVSKMAGIIREIAALPVQEDISKGGDRA